MLFNDTHTMHIASGITFDDDNHLIAPQPRLILLQLEEHVASHELQSTIPFRLIREGRRKERCDVWFLVGRNWYLMRERERRRRLVETFDARPF